MNCSEILNINNPCSLFPNDEQEAKSKFHVLAAKFHPDVNKDSKASDTFIHIKHLYNQVLELIKLGKWEEVGVKEVTTTEGKKYRFKYDHKNHFELGEMLTCKSVVAYFIEENYKNLYDNAIKMISSLKYANDKMKSEMKKYMPEIVCKFKTVDGKYILVIKKTHEVINLQAALDYFDNTSYPKEWDKHAAWIQSRLNNILCYLKYCGIVHNGISTESVFISPEHHGLCLYGGWWYATKEGTKMISVPKKLYNNVPPNVLSSKLSSPITDGEFVKALGRETLKKVKAPKPFENYMKFPATGKPVEDFNMWMDTILPKAYGERKFIKLNLTYEDVYASVK